MCFSLQNVVAPLILLTEFNKASIKILGRMASSDSPAGTGRCVIDTVI